MIAHCIVKDQRYHANWVFIPQFNNGKRPHGTWSGVKKFVFESYFKDGNKGRDVGFVVVKSNNNITLEEKVGFLDAGICKVDKSENITSIGYPGNIGGAQKMVRTHDRLRFRFLLNPWWKPAPFSIYSKMSHGCSGGACK